VPKVQHKPIKSPRKGSNKESKRQPKGSPGLAHRAVRCTREFHSELATFGNLGSHSAIIHRTVRCSTGLSGVPAEQRLSAPTVVCNGYSEQWTVLTARTESEQAPESAPDSEQDLSGAPPDCLVAHLSEAPTIGTQRPGDVAGAPDSVRCAIRQKPSPTVTLVVGAINTPNHPHFIASKFSAIKPHTRALDFIQRHNQRDQILSQVRNHSKQISD
jgi:hypothetical protein